MKVVTFLIQSYFMFLYEQQFLKDFELTVKLNKCKFERQHNYIYT